MQIATFEKLPLRPTGPAADDEAALSAILGGGGSDIEAIIDGEAQ